MDARSELIAEEAFLITRSGEIPEVAYHSSLYYLQEDPEGPGLRLTSDEISTLKEAVISRYRWITLRDLRPENRKKRIYRGIKRSIINLERMKEFARREGLDVEDVLKEVAKKLLEFLEREVKDCKNTGQCSVINCTYDEILEFAKKLGIDPSKLPNGVEELCPP